MGCLDTKLTLQLRVDSRCTSNPLESGKDPTCLATSTSTLYTTESFVLLLISFLSPRLKSPRSRRHQPAGSARLSTWCGFLKQLPSTVQTLSLATRRTLITSHHWVSSANLFLATSGSTTFYFHKPLWPPSRTVLLYIVRHRRRVRPVFCYLQISQSPLESRKLPFVYQGAICGIDSAASF